MNFYFLKYNNYYNRVVKKEDEIENYIPYLVADITQGVINFTVGDGVNTKCILNSYMTANFKGNPDYVVITDSNQNILHRWFVMEAEETRNGQFICQLKRDVVADNFDAIVNSPCYIQKATIPDSNDLIFNSEGINFNQIKVSETLLMDSTKTPWVVGYIASDVTEATGSIANSESYDYVLSSTSHSAWTYSSYNSPSNAVRAIPSEFKLRTFFTDLVLQTARLRSLNSYNTQGRDITDFGATTIGKGYSLYSGEFGTIRDNFIENEWYDIDSIIEHLKTKFNYSEYARANDLIKYNNKRIAFSDGTYLVKVRSINYNVTGTITREDGMVFENDLKPIADGIINNLLQRSISGTNPYFDATLSGVAYYVSMEKISEATAITWHISEVRNKLKDAPYDMFCMPLNPITFGAIPGGDSYVQTEGLALQIANSMPLILGSQLYDIQILPYCPIIKVTTGADNTISTIGLQEHIDFEYIENEENDPIGIILFAQESSFSVNIPNRIDVNNYKVENECDMYRLCSPNYSGVFEFNVAKNGGVKYFEANCTYIPFNPYIQINPNWGRLYGKDYNDNRGLICGGEFSLPIVNDAWKQYQLNNKNYEKSFNRNIQSMELSNKFADIKGVIGASMGLPQLGSVGGAITESIAIADLAMAHTLRKESINLQKDQFNFNLQNIQALPNTLGRTTSFTINNKYFPFLEKYSCSDIERQAFINKIKYEGMTVGTIGTIAEYLGENNTFIKGQMIRIEGDEYFEENHTSEEIANRIAQGVYFG